MKLKTKRKLKLLKDFFIGALFFPGIFGVAYTLTKLSEYWHIHKSVFPLSCLFIAIGWAYSSLKNL